MFGSPLSNDGRGREGIQSAFFRGLDRVGRRKNSAGSTPRNGRQFPDDFQPDVGHRALDPAHLGGTVYSVMHVIMMAWVSSTASIGRCKTD
jgi:hypothetical protein